MEIEFQGTSARVGQEFRNTLSTAGNSMTSSERPSPEPLLKKEAPPAVLGGEIILEMLWKSQMPSIIGFGGSQPHSRREFPETLRERFRGLSGILPEFLPESPSRTGGVAQEWSGKNNEREDHLFVKGQ